MTAEQVSQLVTKVLGKTPLAVTRMTFGHNSVSYEVTLPDRALIVRTNANSKVFSGTAHNLSTLRELGLPVSKIIASDLTQTRYPSAYMILEKIPGRDLRYELSSMTPARKKRLAVQIVGYQGKVATLPPGDGFGYASIGEAAPFSSWRELVISEICKDLLPDLEPSLASWRDRVFALAGRFTPHLEQVSPTCFLDDLTIKNVIVQDGELRGLIDFDGVCYGDPLWTLGLTAAAIIFDLGPDHLDYVEELYRAYCLDDTGRAVVSLYAALFALTFLARGNPTETDRMVRALEAWVEPLEH